MDSDKTPGKRAAALAAKAMAPRASARKSRTVAASPATSRPAPKAAPKLAASPAPELVAKPAPKPVARPIPKLAVNVSEKRATPTRVGKPASTTASRLNKAGFVRAQPLSVSATQVVRAARKLGMVMSPDYVYKVRSTAKAAMQRAAPNAAAPVTAAAASAPRKKAALMPAARPVVARRVQAHDPEPLFLRMVVDLGLARARAVVSAI